MLDLAFAPRGEGPADWFWVALVAAASAAQSRAFACATPFAVLVTLAALTLRGRDAITSVVWSGRLIRQWGSGCSIIRWIRPHWLGLEQSARHPLQRLPPRTLTRSIAAADICKAIDQGEIFLAHAFEYACAQSHIDHRLTKPRHP